MCNLIGYYMFPYVKCLTVLIGSVILSTVSPILVLVNFYSHLEVPYPNKAKRHYVRFALFLP
jgi:hypothetical protein